MSRMSSLSHCISQIFKVSEKNNLPLLDLSASPQVKMFQFTSLQILMDVITVPISSSTDLFRFIIRLETFLQKEIIGR